MGIHLSTQSTAARIDFRIILRDARDDQGRYFPYCSCTTTGAAILSPYIF